MTQVTRRIVRVLNKVLATSVDCPLGEVGPGAAAPLPLFEGGDLTATGGRGGSITSSSVRTGFGGWAGGKSAGTIT